MCAPHLRLTFLIPLDDSILRYPSSNSQQISPMQLLNQVGEVEVNAHVHTYICALSQYLMLPSLSSHHAFIPVPPLCVTTPFLPFSALLYPLGSVMKLDSLKARVDKSCLPSQHVHTSRGGTRNVGSTHPLLYTCHVSYVCDHDLQLPTHTTLTLQMHTHRHTHMCTRHTYACAR